ncbi:hypothetical protein [Pseudomonas sp. MPR-R1B]|jgi:hypothetical protein|nr:hypothetical protein [Pseudomonas sp. MPR-R1B]
MSTGSLSDLYAQALREIREIAETAGDEEPGMLTIAAIAADALANGDGEP